MVVLLTASATTGAPAGTSGYTLLLADGAAEVAAAQRLRHRVFAGELGATLHSSVPGMDVDEMDDFCDHLIVREDTTGEVVGTYRLLPPDAAARAGRRYSDTEFNLAALEPMRDCLVETGRSCVHPDHRSGAVINLIWAGIARYLHLGGYRWLGGCASVPLDVAAPVWEEVRAKHLSPPALRVRPYRPWLAEPGVPATVQAARRAAGGPAGGSAGSGGLRRAPAGAGMPPLLRGYLRLGAWACGDPAYDPDFRVADLFVLLSMDRIHPRYLRHFLGELR